MPDSGNKYLSKVYNDYWMIDQGFLERERHRRFDESRLARDARQLHASMEQYLLRRRDGAGLVEHPPRVVANLPPDPCNAEQLVDGHVFERSDAAQMRKPSAA